MQHGKITVQEAETVIHYTESRYYTLDDDEGFMTYFHVFDVTLFFSGMFYIYEIYHNESSCFWHELPFTYSTLRENDIPISPKSKGTFLWNFSLCPKL